MFNKTRKVIEGERSSLFREYIRVLQAGAGARAGLLHGFVGIGECTRISLQDEFNISSELGWLRMELCDSGSSRVNRPRNYWTYPDARGGEGFEVWADASGQRGWLVGPIEPSCAWLLPHWTWAGEDSEWL